MRLKPILLPALILSFTLSTPSFATVTKEVWKTRVIELLPPMLCKHYQSNPALRQQMTANKINQTDCVKHVRASTVSCMNQINNQLPANIDQKAGRDWGRKLGGCVGITFYKNHIKKNN